uniref:Potassium channel domain-containing protein n=1 Tax=Acrobeloides nanus TaxID=290746 RepID=A0A914CKS2_9BILA
MFMWLEVPIDLASKKEAYEYHLVARDVLLHNIKLIHTENPEDQDHRWKEAILQFESSIGIALPSLETDWTFEMAMLYAGTIYTTIGYGNISCKTTGGRLASIIYGIIGIPLLLTLPSLPASDYNESNMSPRSRAEEDEDVKRDPPMAAALIVTFGWIFLTSACFSVWEDWDYFTSVYFCFISLLTIGFGDISPANPQYSMLTFVVVIVGLALVTVCINVAQEKIAQLYMRMLEKMLEQTLFLITTSQKPWAPPDHRIGGEETGSLSQGFFTSTKLINRSASTCDTMAFVSTNIV